MDILQLRPSCYKHGSAAVDEDDDDNDDDDDAYYNNDDDVLDGACRYIADRLIECQSAICGTTLAGHLNRDKII